MDLAVTNSTGISDYGHKVQGCSLCEAASEVIGALVDQQGTALTRTSIAKVRSDLERYLAGEQESPPWTSLSVLSP